MTRLRRRRLPRARRRARALAAGARAAGRRDRRRREPAGLGRRGAGRRARDREPAAAAARGQREPRHRRDHGRRTSSSRTPTRCRAADAVAAAGRVHGRAPAVRHRRARRCCGRTGPGSRRAAASRPSRGRSSAARRCGGSIRRTSASATTTCSTSAPTEPVEADWMLGAFLLQRRTMLDEIGGWDAGYRHYVEDIDLCYRAMRAGWERWYVPAAVVRHAYAAVIDRRFLSRHTLWHLRGMARFARKHPEALVASPAADQTRRLEDDPELGAEVAPLGVARIERRRLERRRHRHPTWNGPPGVGIGKVRWAQLSTTQPRRCGDPIDDAVPLLRRAPSVPTSISTRPGALRPAEALPRQRHEDGPGLSRGIEAVVVGADRRRGRRAADPAVVEHARQATRAGAVAPRSARGAALPRSATVSPAIERPLSITA